MTPLRCLIVDDEPQARAVLRHHIADLDVLALVGECPNALAAFETLQHTPVDLLFLDIQMPRVTGLDLLRTLRQPPKTVLTTAYREYALDSYDLDVVDYLLKPIPFDRFLKAVQKAFRHVHLPAASAPLQAAGGEPFLYFRADRKMVKVLLCDILYVESLKDYVRVVTTHGAVVTKQAISSLEASLPPHRFVRVHRSYIVAPAQMTSFNSREIQFGDTTLPVGRMYREAWLRAVEQV
jgi:DNA-binding LytR/AlgR family response regulator